MWRWEELGPQRYLSAPPWPKPPRLLPSPQDPGASRAPAAPAPQFPLLPGGDSPTLQAVLPEPCDLQALTSEPSSPSQERPLSRVRLLSLERTRLGQPPSVSFGTGLEVGIDPAISNHYIQCFLSCRGDGCGTHTSGCCEDHSRGQTAKWATNHKGA